MADSQVGDWGSHKTGHHDQSDIGKIIYYKDYNKNPVGSESYKSNNPNLVNYKDYNKRINSGEKD